MVSPVQVHLEKKKIQAEIGLNDPAQAHQVSPNKYLQSSEPRGYFGGKWEKGSSSGSKMKTKPSIAQRTTRKEGVLSKTPLNNREIKGGIRKHSNVLQQKILLSAKSRDHISQEVMKSGPSQRQGKVSSIPSHRDDPSMGIKSHPPDFALVPTINKVLQFEENKDNACFLENEGAPVERVGDPPNA